MGTASVCTLASLWIEIAIKPQTSHVLRRQNGQGNRRSVPEGLRGGDIQPEEHNLWIKHVSRTLMIECSDADRAGGLSNSSRRGGAPPPGGVLGLTTGGGGG